MANIGSVSLWLALVASVYSAVGFSIGGKDGNRTLVKTARYALGTTFILVSAAVAGLLYALLTHDFSLTYVAYNSSLDMSPLYIISSLWAGNEGSLLFWSWLLTLFGIIFLLVYRRNHRGLVTYSAAVTMFTTMFFIILMLATANPFQRLGFTPADGYGLNPMLENPGMLIHPVMLLAGYSGATIPFAIGVAALLSGRLNKDWIGMARSWALVAWLLLGIGNVIGAWWAYVELGWGGYWAWDPVENASLMPWLVLTAFIHSLSIQRIRGTFKMWSMSLVVIAFVLTIFGTYLTRSGILSSVHAFPQTGLGPYFIVFMLLALIIPAWLMYFRRKELAGPNQTESFVSREGTFLLNNLLFIGSTAVILLGTLFPLLSRITTGRDVEVGASFFNRVNAPIFIGIIFLAGICTTIGWKKASGRNILSNLLWPFVVAAVATIVVVILGVHQAAVVFGVFAGVFVIGTVVLDWTRAALARRRAEDESFFAAWLRLLRVNRPRYGGYIIHTGIVVFAIGVVVSSSYSVERDVTLAVGESVTVQGYQLTYGGLQAYETARRLGVSASLNIDKNGQTIGHLTSLKYYDPRFEEQSAEQRQWVTDVGIRSTFFEDLYVILIGWDDTSAALKILVNPLVMWLWIGGGIVILGGLIAFWPSRRSLPGLSEAAGQLIQPPPRPQPDARISDDIERRVEALRQSKRRTQGRKK